jgi:transcription elongation GreA/GreB family factor
MSRAFVKEDVEIAERSTRRRSASGLPPGALNYMTTGGAEQLRKRLAKLRAARTKDEAQILKLESVLASATIVEPQVRPEVVTFGAPVTVEDADGKRQTFRIVGVDEVELEPGSVSWISPIGRALLGMEPGQTVSFPGEEKTIRTVVKIG